MYGGSVEQARAAGDGDAAHAAARAGPAPPALRHASGGHLRQRVAGRAGDAVSPSAPTFLDTTWTVPGHFLGDAHPPLRRRAAAVDALLLRLGGAAVRRLRAAPLDAPAAAATLAAASHAAARVAVRRRVPRPPARAAPPPRHRRRRPGCSRRRACRAVGADGAVCRSPLAPHRRPAGSVELARPPARLPLPPRRALPPARAAAGGAGDGLPPQLVRPRPVLGALRRVCSTAAEKEGLSSLLQLRAGALRRVTHGRLLRDGGLVKLGDLRRRARSREPRVPQEKRRSFTRAVVV